MDTTRDSRVSVTRWSTLSSELILHHMTTAHSNPCTTHPHAQGLEKRRCPPGTLICRQLAHGGQRPMSVGWTYRQAPPPAPHPGDVWELLQSPYPWAFPHPPGWTNPQASQGSGLAALYRHYCPTRAWALDACLQESLSQLCVGCHRLMDAQRQGPGPPEPDRPAPRARKAADGLLHGDHVAQMPFFWEAAYLPKRLRFLGPLAVQRRPRRASRSHWWNLS